MGNYYGYNSAVWARLMQNNRRNFQANLSKGMSSIGKNVGSFVQEVGEAKEAEAADQRQYTQATEARDASKNFLEYSMNLTGQKLENADKILKPVPDPAKGATSEEMTAYIDTMNKSINNYASVLMKNYDFTQDQLGEIANRGAAADIDLTPITKEAGDVKTKRAFAAEGQKIQTAIGPRAQQDITQTIPQQEPTEMKTEVSPQQFELQTQQPAPATAAQIEETTTIPSREAATTREEGLSRLGPDISYKRAMEDPKMRGLQTERDLAYMEELKHRNYRMWQKVNEGKADDFKAEFLGLAGVRDRNTKLVDSTQKVIDSSLAEIKENDNAISTMTKSLENLDEDDPDEAEQIENINNKIDELKNTNHGLNEKKLKHEKDIIEREKDKMVYGEALGTYIDSEGTISLQKSLKQGREAMKEGAATTIPTKKKTKFPEKTFPTAAIGPDTTVRGGKRPQYVQSFDNIEEARKVKKSGETVRIRINTAEEAKRFGEEYGRVVKIGEYLPVRLR